MSEKLLKSNDSILLKVKSDKIFPNFLNKMNEPKLETFKGETYRFIIVGAFGNNEVYRINKNSNEYYINTKTYFKNLGDKTIDSLSKEKKIKINENNWLQIKNSIYKLNFWCLPVRINDNHYLDGTGYLIEGYNIEKNECTNRNYHATIRISPSDTTEYKKLFKKIIKLSSK